MKNIFKYLSVFALAGAVGLQTLNVSAEETCEPGEVEHTNYYIFLDVNGSDWYEEQINGQPDGASLTLWNGAYKYNNVQRGKIIEDGAIAITKGSETTNGDASKSWTAAEYWQKYYKATQNKDSNLVYTVGNESYFLHDNWWTYDANYENGVEKSHTNTAIQSALASYLRGNYSSLANSDLVSKGTSLPTSKIDIPANLATSTDSSLMWHISRVFGDKDILSGVTLNGQTVVYSPAVHYVKFCAKGTSTTEKTVEYDANTTDVVTNMPNKNTFTDECTTISSNTPVRTGYQFLGWSSAADATLADNNYAPGKEYCGGSIVLHAVWKKADVNPDGSFTVTYDANGGKNAPSTQNGAAGSCVTISSAKPTLAGNNFLGWSTDKHAKEPNSAYAAGTNYCGAEGNITLYAVWQTQTGISAHFVAFAAGIAIIARGLLLVANKKQLFRQI